MTLLQVAEDVGATYRLTQLVTRDALTQGLRARIAAWQKERLLSQGDVIVMARRYGQDVADEGGPLAYLVQCPWCTSLWVAAGVVLARRVLPLPWAPVARALSMSAITGWLSERS